MNRFLLTATALVLAGGLGTGAAMAQEATAGTEPGQPVYGAPAGVPPAGAVPPAALPGFRYQWVYGYDQHAIYRGHWEAVRVSG